MSASQSQIHKAAIAGKSGCHCLTENFSCDSSCLLCCALKCSLWVLTDGGARSGHATQPVESFPYKQMSLSLPIISLQAQQCKLLLAKQ